MTKEGIIRNLTLTVLMIAFIGTLYFFTSTASLRDTYQPGIEELQRLLNPNYLSIGTLVCVVIFKKDWWLPVAKVYYIGALFSCIVIGVFVSTYQTTPESWVFPEDRTLIKTIERSLFHPSFSGRSTARAVFSGVISLIALGITMYIERYR